MTSTIRRRFDVDSDYVFDGYDDRQRLYLDRGLQELLPHTQIWQGGLLQMQVNSLGCKGPEIDPKLPVIAYVGDSATMGHGFSPDSWPLHVEVPGYTNLNAAIEGTDMQTVADRWERLRERVDVACLVVYVGWHNLVYNRSTEDFWEEQLSRFLGGYAMAFCNIATCLTEEFRTRGIQKLLNRDQRVSSVSTQTDAESIDNDYFGFFGAYAPEEYLVPLLDAIDRYNEFLAGFAGRSNVTLIDLHTFLQPTTYEAATRDFYDVCHIRPRAYPHVGRFVTEKLGPVLASGPAQRPRETIATVEAEGRTEDPRANIYPIW